jgi:hypothetical protein
MDLDVILKHFETRVANIIQDPGRAYNKIFRSQVVDFRFDLASDRFVGLEARFVFAELGAVALNDLQLRVEL